LGDISVDGRIIKGCGLRMCAVIKWFGLGYGDSLLRTRCESLDCMKCVDIVDELSDIHLQKDDCFILSVVLLALILTLLNVECLSVNRYVSGALAT
jgi:hypothetical protein